MTKHFLTWGWKTQMRIQEKREAVSDLMMTVRRPSKAEDEK